MKSSKCLFAAILLLVSACQSTAELKEKTAYEAVKTLSIEEKKVKRENDIKEAVNNKEMIVGQWDLVAVDSAGIKIEKLRLSEIPFTKLAFYKDLTFKYFRGASFVNSGMYEWIADNREMVLTSENGTGHLLVRKLDEKNLVVTELPLKLYFNRIK